MPITKKVVYVGPKAKKVYPYQGRKLIFPRDVSVDVEEVLAYQLLEYPEVFIEPEGLEEVKKAREAAAKAEAERKEAEMQALKDEILANSATVFVLGERQDLNKKNTGQLKTIIKAEGLDIDPATVEKQDGETPLQALKRVVKDALIAKHGLPEDEE